MIYWKHYAIYVNNVLRLESPKKEQLLYPRLKNEHVQLLPLKTYLKLLI